MKSTNHKQYTKSSPASSLARQPKPAAQHGHGLDLSVTPEHQPGLLPPHCGIWMTRDRVVMAFRLDGYGVNDMTIEFPKEHYDPGQLLTVKDLAGLMKVSHAYVREHADQWPFTKPFNQRGRGRDLRFVYGEYRAWLDEQGRSR